MRAFVVALLVLLQSIALLDAAHAASGVTCRKSCGLSIAASCEGLRRRPFLRCKRALIRRCKKTGTDSCAIATTTTTISSTTTTTAAPCPGQVSCGAFCCDNSNPICASNGDAACCPAAFAVYCPDRGAGRYCCETGNTCTTSTTEKRCIAP